MIWCNFNFTCNLAKSAKLLFFAVYVIYKKNSFSRVVFLFFYLTKTANSFYSKINDSSMVWTTTFSRSRFRVRVSVVPNIFTIHPLHFLMPEISETLKGSFTKFFGTVRQKIFDGNLWYPLLCIKFFDTPNFLRHWRDAHEIFRHCETKNFRRKIVIAPIMHKFFRYPKFSETLKGCPRNFSALWDKKFRRKIVIAPIMHKIFRYPKFSETLKGCPRNFSSIKLFETKIFSKTVGFPYESFRQCET